MNTSAPSPRRLPFTTVDVFTAEPFFGNPVAVVLDAQGLDAEQMQRIARWMNLSETTFVLPPSATDADYQVRIFTPAAELPFAGHPTLGTAHALLEAGRITPRSAETGGLLLQECGVGLVRLSIETTPGGGRWLSFELPTPKIRALGVEEQSDLERVLATGTGSLTGACLIDVGPRWVVAPLGSAEAVLACRPDLARLAAMDMKLDRTGVVIFGEHAPGKAARLEVRAFAPAHGVPEDPVCGSGNGAVGAWLRHAGRVPVDEASLLVTQGGAVGRAGRIRLSLSEAAIRVGGQCVTCVTGILDAPAFRMR